MEDEATTLFRATTLASTLMEQYMKATATQFVHHALKDSILKIMESKQSCELSPSKLEKNEDVNTNLAHLLNILSELVEKIFMASEILPPHTFRACGENIHGFRNTSTVSVEILM